MSRFLLVGDVCGEYEMLFETVENQLKKQSFDALICVGNFFNGTKFEKKFNIPTYIIDSLESEYSQTIAQTVLPNTLFQIHENLFFVAPLFVGEICGIKFACLAGKYDIEVFETSKYSNSGNMFEKEFYTESALKWFENEISNSTIVVSSCWPEGFSRYIPNLLVSSTSPVVASLVSMARPKYIVCSTANQYCMHEEGGKCSLIGLGKVGPMTKETRWIHAISVHPDEEEIEGEWPFGRIDSDQQKEKRQRCEDVKEIFVSNIPYDVSEVGLEGYLKSQFGKLSGFAGIKKLMASRGFAILRFRTGEDAVHAVDRSQEIRLGPRKLYVKLSHSEGKGKGKGKGTENQSDSYEDCWFCVSNPNFDSHLLYGMMGEDFFISVAKGSLTKGHSVICPVTHYGCFVELPEKLKEHACEFIRKALAFFGSNLVYYERWIPMGSANHMQIHCVPLEEQVDWIDIVKAKGRSVGVEFMVIQNYYQVAEKMNGLCNRVSYLYISVPSGSKRVHLLGMGKLDLTFPREIICQGIYQPDRIDWRKCVSEKDSEEASALEMRKKWAEL